MHRILSPRIPVHPVCETTAFPNRFGNPHRKNQSGEPFQDYPAIPVKDRGSWLHLWVELHFYIAKNSTPEEERW